MEIKTKNGIVVATGINMDEIAGNGYSDQGWNPMWGDETVEKYVSSNLRPNQAMVDLGGAIGRVSMSHSMRGGEVIIVDTNAHMLEEGNRLRHEAGAKTANTINMDIRNLHPEQVGKNVGAVVAIDTLQFLSKKDADLVIERAPQLLGSEGGHILLNVPSQDSPLYQNPNYFGAQKVEEGTMDVPAGCHGGRIRGSFYKPGELDSKLALAGGQILDSQTEDRGSIVFHEVVAKFKPRI